MAQIGLDLYFTGFTGSLLVVWKKASSPLAEVGRSDALPFPVDETIAVPNLSSETYNFEFWQSSDGIALDTLIRGPWSIDASAYAGGIAKQYEYVVNRGQNNTTPVSTGTEVWADPVEGDTEITDERYAGVAKEDIEVQMRGTGKRRTDEWDVKTGGGIKLLVGGETFADQDSIFVNVFQKISTDSVGGGSSSSSSDYTDVKNVSSNDTVGASYKNKLINCTGASPVTTITFPALSSLADQKMKFITHNMTGNYLTLKFNGSETVSFAGASRNQIHLSQGRMWEILIKSNVVYVLSDIAASGYDVRGRRDFADDVKPHQRLRDGEVRSIDEYPGIVEWIQTLPLSAIVTSSASWNTDANRHKYYLNVGANEFALPDDRNMHARALSVFDGSQAIGRFEVDALKAHTHTTDIPSRDFSNSGSTGPDLTGSDGGASGGSHRTFTTSSIGGSENTVKNYGQLAVINI
jgi:hypothetical protein